METSERCGQKYKPTTSALRCSEPRLFLPRSFRLRDRLSSLTSRQDHKVVLGGRSRGGKKKTKRFHIFLDSHGEAFHSKRRDSLILLEIELFTCYLKMEFKSSTSRQDYQFVWVSHIDKAWGVGLVSFRSIAGDTPCCGKFLTGLRFSASYQLAAKGNVARLGTRPGVLVGLSIWGRRGIVLCM